jgi:uncharacterized protein (TIGR03437 family)
MYTFFGGRFFASPGAYVGVLGTNIADATGPGAGAVRITVNGVDAEVNSRNLSPGGPLQADTFRIPPQTAIGPATLVVSLNGVASAPFAFSVQQYSPNLSTFIYHLDRSRIVDTNPAKPGETIFFNVTGLGAIDPPPAPSLTVGGIRLPVQNLQTSLYPFNNNAGIYSFTIVVPPDLPSGSYPITLSIGGVTSDSIFIPVFSEGLVLSQTGATFRTVAGSPGPLQRSVSIVSNALAVNWTASATTVSGGNWLQVTPSQGTSDPARPAPSIQVAAVPGSLDPGDYYGTVTIASNGPPRTISVVLSILTPDRSPGATVEPTGLAFTAAPGSAPAAKTFQVSNPTTAALTFTISATSSTSTRWFQFQPISGTAAPSQPGTISVQPNAGLAAGTYTGAITLSFSDGNSRVVNLVAVVATGASSTSAAFAEDGVNDAGCVPTKLLPIFTLLGINFVSPVGWPSNIEAVVVDDCGSLVSAGSVTASFSNSDPALPLTSLQNGRWTGTWTPRSAVNSNLTVTLTATSLLPVLQGSTTISGAAPSNPNVPIISVGGAVGSATYAPAPSPGTLISIFGIALADRPASASQLPLTNQLSTTRVLIAGVPVPLLFVGANQINAQVPYKLPAKTTYQVIVQRGTALSTPEPLAIQDSQPAVFTVDGSGKGPGHVYRVTPDFLQILVSPSAPVKAGDVLTIYCAGLGEVSPALVAGAAAPLDTLENTVTPVTATIGGKPAEVLFAGLTPGFVGLYQVNLVVPAAAAGDDVPLVLTIDERSSSPAPISIR